MRGVSFDGFHTFRDWGLHMEGDYGVSPAEAITCYIDIPGRKTKLDVTEALYGRIPYENRTLTFNFWIKCRHTAWMRLTSKIQNAIGGKRCKIILDTEPDRYWMGRVTVRSGRRQDAEYVLAEYQITCDVEPYKYWTQEPGEWLWDPFSFVDGYIQNLKDLKVSGTLNQKVVLTNPAYLVFECTNNMGLNFLGKSYQLKANEPFEIDEEFSEGEYDLTFTGNGTVSITMKGETL